MHAGMHTDGAADDLRAIEALVARQFASLCWAEDRPADWGGFAADFLPDASLYPAARPAEKRSVAAFAGRMRGLAETRLRSFHERPLGRDPGLRQRGGRGRLAARSSRTARRRAARSR